MDIDKAEIGKNVSPDFSVQGDVKTWIKEILPKLKEQKHPKWWEEIHGFEKTKAKVEGDFHPKHILDTLRKFTKDDTVIATDVGQHQMWTAQYYRFEKGRTFLSSGGLGTMGYGLGAAIGACFGRKREHTVLITSDGSFGMNCNELCTAVHEKLPITIILMNNRVLGMVRQWQTAFFDKRYSETVLDRSTDFVKLIEAYGGKGFSAGTCKELEEALKERENYTGPILINCSIKPDEKVLPMIPPGKSVDDIIL